MTEISPSSNIEQELSNLGDPSGRQDAKYWDEWFKVVCTEEHRPFEWYCSVDEVVRVLSHHIGMGSRQKNQPTCKRMIHPGSGTSLVPLKLREVFATDQVVVDVSAVSVDEMKRVHEQQYPSEGPSSNSLEYLVADILNPPLPFEESSFDCWVDKGFVDAVFSKESNANNRGQSRRLFEEANRLLQCDTGVSLVVSLAEEHSLQLLLENALKQSWQPDIHVWELCPVSGDMLPFGLVFTKSSPPNDESALRCVIWHFIDGETEEEPTPAESLLNVIRRRVEASREAFTRSRKLKEKTNAVRKVRATLEIKPYDAETDLKALGSVVRAMQWGIMEGNTSRTLSPRWQPFDDSAASMEEIVPIGFGISKLQLRCILPSDDVDILVDAIEEWQGNEAFEDGIQSVDVDWTNTIPVGDASDLLGGR